jgi:glycine reductase
MRIVHYLNQFFAGIGGEAAADAAPRTRAGAVGPGLALQRALGGAAEVVGTVICGDGRFVDHMEATAPEVLRLIEDWRPDAVVAGPAFTAGRYGVACGRVCRDVTRRLGRPAITGMHPDNAAVELYRRDVLIARTGPTAAGMAPALDAMARLVLRLASGARLGPASVEGYLPTGRRLNGRVERPASARALDMLLARARGESFNTEVPLPSYDCVLPPPALADTGRARLALVSECGLVPSGNPDRLEWVRASKWLKYAPAATGDLVRGRYEVAHGGYDAAFALEDPNRLIPLDAVRELARRGEIGEVLPAYYVTCGNHGILSQMAQHAREIAADLRAQNVDAVLLVAT